MRSWLSILLCFGLALPAKAYHIVGGEMYYDCLGGNEYLITLKLYRDCSGDGAPFDNPLYMAVYNGDGTLFQSLELPFPGSTLIDPDLTNPCMVNPPDVCVEEAIYTRTITLPDNPLGYDIVYQRCCRNSTIVNLIFPEQQGATYTAHIPDPGSICNSSPRFNSFPPVVICAGYPFNFDHAASDPDGDQLVYEFCRPYQGASFDVPAPEIPSPPPFPYVTYTGGYSEGYPLDASPPLVIDSLTGWMEGTPASIGQYVVGVCVKEYRDGVLIGEHYRDFQFNVTDCTPGLYADFPDEYNNCDDYTIFFDNNSFGATTWFWDFGDPSVDNDTSVVMSPSYVYPDTGTYTVMLVAKPYTVCADTAYSIVQIYPGLVANFAYEPQCAGQPLNFSDVSVSTYGYLEQWSWSFGDGTEGTGNTPSHVYEEGGTYEVHLQILNGYGCTKGVEHTVTVWPTPDVDFVWDDACLQSVGTLTEQVFIDSAYSITGLEWTYPDGTGSTGSFGAYYFDTAGAYPVTLVATSNKGCMDSITNQVVVYPKVVADVFRDSTICEGDTIQLFTRNGKYYQWSPNYNISDLLDHDPFVYPDVSTTYTVVISDDCTSDTAQIIIEVLPAPDAVAWNDTAVYRFEPVMLHAAGGVSYSWDPPNYMNDPFSQDPVVMPSETDSYVVTVTAENGCTATDTVSIVVWLRCMRFTIPTAFSPNGDGLNDVFRISSFGDDEVSNYQIYNRWGELVFEAGSIDTAWDGTTDGKKQETGVYIYYITIACEGQQAVYSGNITLLN